MVPVQRTPSLSCASFDQWWHWELKQFIYPTVSLPSTLLASWDSWEVDFVSGKSDNIGGVPPATWFFLRGGGVAGNFIPPTCVKWLNSDDSHHVVVSTALIPFPLRMVGVDGGVWVSAFNWVEKLWKVLLHDADDELCITVSLCWETDTGSEVLVSLSHESQ